MASLFARLDAQLDHLFAGWNVYSTTLVVLLIAVLFLPLFFSSEPDIHPYLLARQAAASPVRESGQSAVYRSLDVPHGYPLRSGLNLKDETTSKWGPGKDGDLRDIWLIAAKAGAQNQEKILTLKGNDQPITSKFDQLSRQINAIGTHFQRQGSKKIAIYLPNSTEFLVSLFACVFYNITPILIPLDIDLDGLQKIISETQADSIIAPGGVLSMDDLTKVAPKAKVVFVTPSTSQQMDFTEDFGSATAWHTLVNESNAPSDLPKGDDAKHVPNIVSIWHDKSGTQIVEYTQANLISAIAAQLAVLPRGHSLKETDLIVSLSPLTQTFALSLVLAGLFAHASIALTSVAGLAPDYELAFQGGIKPTIIIASTATMAKAHVHFTSSNQGLFTNIRKSRYASLLAAGKMHASVHQSLRLIYISAGPSSASLKPQELNDLRIGTGSRIIHSLILPQVVGAVTQTNPLDYRIGNLPTRTSHFGAPLSSVEIKVVQSREKISDDDYKPVGSLMIAGPAVVGGSVATDVLATFGDDQTLQLL